MSTVDDSVVSTVSEWPVENDLSTIACNAAVELDNLILDRSIGLSSVDRLRNLLSESIPQEHDQSSPNWLRDPTTVVVVNRALSDGDGKQISTVDELVREAGEVIARFSELLRDPVGFRAHSLNKLNDMRSFCLALSRRASATKESPLDRTPEHSFRR